MNRPKGVAYMRSCPNQVNGLKDGTPLRMKSGGSHGVPNWASESLAQGVR